MTVQDARTDLANRTRSGVSSLLAALLLWIGLAAAGIILQEPQQRGLAYLVGAVLYFPSGLIVGRLLRAQAPARGNPLGLLYLFVCGLELPLSPILVGTVLTAPESTPWYLGIIFGVQFLFLAWLFNSSAYLFCALATIEVACLAGWLMPALSHVVTPFLLIAVMQITLTFVRRDNVSAGRRARRPGPQLALPTEEQK